MSNSAEAIVVASLNAVDIESHLNVAPEHVTVPYVVCQAVGGQDVNDLDGPADLENARMQITAWSDTSLSAIACLRAARDALVAAGALPIGAPVGDYDPDTLRHGSRLDFSIWFKP